MDDDYKKIIKESFSVSGAVYLVLVWVFFIIVRPSIKTAIIVFLSLNILTFIYKYGYNDLSLTTPDVKKSRITSLLTGSLAIILIFHIISWLDFFLGNKGFYGLLIIVVVLAAYRIIRQWKSFLKAVELGQRAITGGPTFKEQREDRELMKHERFFKNDEH